MRYLTLLFLFSVATTAISVHSKPVVAQEKKAAKTKSWDEIADAGVAYLKSKQADDGTWSKATHPGITAVILNGLLKSGKVTADDQTVQKGLKYIETMIDTTDGHLASASEQIRHKYYVTSVNLQALKASGVKKYDPVIAKAVGYFQKNQVGQTDGKKESDANFGGFGYGPQTRGDMSNTHFVLDAVTSAGLSKDDPLYKRTLVFVSRMQNLKSEWNDQPWAGKINDGSFIYVLPSPEGTTPVDAERPGYGSMTYAGVKSLAICGVSHDDPRFKKAMEWISKNYSVDVNPGRAEGAGGQGYYYYLVSMAKCLSTIGVDEVADAAGKKHDWRAEITRALTNRQRKDGSWGSDFGQWMEGNSDLDTAYALIALSYTKPKNK